MASGHRKRKAALLRAYTLTPAGLSNVSENDRGILANQNNLINLALYASGGYSPTFTQGQATRLSDAVSNADNIWSSTAVNGATGISGGETTFQIPTTTRHYSMPVPGTANQSISLSAPGVAPSNVGGIIVYSKDGPQAAYSPYYISDNINGTSSISFTTTITGAFPGSTKLLIYVAGAINSSSATPPVSSDEVRIYTGSIATPLNFNTVGTPATAQQFSDYLVLTSSNRIYMSATRNIAGMFLNNATQGLRIVFSSSVSQANSTTTSPGWFVYITGSN